jgi:hypothetical protein
MLERVAKIAQCGDLEIRALMKAGSESVAWVRNEFAGVDLGDKRLDRRLIKTAALLTKSPGAPITRRVAPGRQREVHIGCLTTRRQPLNPSKHPTLKRPSSALPR